MEHLFILLFFTGVVPLIQSGPREYYLIQQSMTWSDAQAYCRTHHADLAVVESDDDMTRLRDEIQYQQFSSDAWIGLHILFIWSFENEPLRLLTKWYPGEPDFGGGSIQCYVIGPMGWGDSPCHLSLPFVCFDETKTGNQRYIYISATKPWEDAQTYCRNYHTDLATVRDEAENSAVVGLLSTWSWFGLIKVSWKWLNQTTFSTISWMSGQPDNARRAEHCGFINNGEAADAPCSDTMPFFCYSDITGKQQIMRMEVPSDKDVNDPAVINAIMARIQQKLEERGLVANITVKWRIQPDRKVFHKKKKEE